MLAVALSCRPIRAAVRRAIALAATGRGAVLSPYGRVRDLAPVLGANGIGWHTLGMHGPKGDRDAFTGQAEDSAVGRGLGASVAGVLKASPLMRRQWLGPRDSSQRRRS
jgi:hypothetical protein